MILPPWVTAIETDPDRCGGLPVIAGTRFTVSQLLVELAGGASVSELAEDMDLPEERLQQALKELAALLRERPP